MNELTSALSDAEAASARGQWPLVRRICEQALQFAPNHQRLLTLLGRAMLEEGEAPGVEKMLEQALAAGAVGAAMLQVLADAYVANGKRRDAVGVLRDAVTREPDNVDAWLDLGYAFARIGDVASAARQFEHVLTIAPESARAYAGLARLAMAGARDHEATQFSGEAIARAPDLLAARLVLAELALLRNQYEEVLEHLAQANFSAPESSAADRVSGCFLEAQACEALAKYDRAFKAYRTAGKIQQDRFRSMRDEWNAASFDTVAEMRAYVGAFDVGATPTRSDAASGPVFFLGYPRSGTTLIEQVLASHREVETLEERGVISDFYAEIVQNGGGIDRLERLTAQDVQSFRVRYWRKAEEALGQPPRRRVLVDKMPLNTVLLPLIAWLFPQAKILFAVRDPRDVVLSCFTQRFQMNRAMYYFLTIDGAARHYNAVMELASVARRRLPLQFHDVRYEDVVHDFDNTIASVLAFLGLPWDDNVREFVRTAKARRINTPSAPDVRLPLYNTSIQRWRKFAGTPEVAAAFAALGPWVEAYGYGSERHFEPGQDS